MTIHHLRRSYEKKSLERSDLDSDPIAQFQGWFQEAAEADKPEWLEINAMTLSTLDPASGSVAGRIVLLKHVDQDGFTFFSNYESDKARQLEAHPQASLVLYWPHVERQVRIQGTVSKTDRATSERYFQERPRASQLGAIASRQSRAIADRVELEAAVAKLEQENAGREIPCPPYWGGFRLSPSRIEFWQGRPSRLHDRFVFVRSSNDGRLNWSIERLSP